MRAKYMAENGYSQPNKSPEEYQQVSVRRIKRAFENGQLNIEDLFSKQKAKSGNKSGESDFAIEVARTLFPPTPPLKQVNRLTLSANTASDSQTPKSAKRKKQRQRSVTPNTKAKQRTIVVKRSRASLNLRQNKHNRQTEHDNVLGAYQSPNSSIDTSFCSITSQNEDQIESDNQNTSYSDTLEDPSQQFLSQIALSIGTVNANMSKSPANPDKKRRMLSDEVSVTGESKHRDVQNLVNTAHTELQKMNESNADANPTTIGVEAVIAMFSEIRERLDKNAITEDLETFKYECVTQAAQAANTAVQHQQSEIIKLKDELSHYKTQNRILSEVCERFNTQIKELEQRMDTVELNNTKKMVILSGLYTDTRNKKTLADFVQNFLEVNLGIHVEIEEIFTLGRKEPKPIVISFQTMHEKRLTMKYKYLLNNAQQQYGKVYINDYVPAATQERRHREQQIIDSIDDNENPNKIKFVGGSLFVHNQQYRDKVEPPSPKELISMTPEELKRILNLQLRKGADVNQEQSRFTAYTAAVNSHSQIRDLYKRLKLIEPGARHIPCAYWLQGEQQHYTRSFHNDGEPGAGRVLLDFLLENELKSRVVFVARRYGGLKMGSDRFDCYHSAAKSAVLADSFNHIMDTRQTVSSIGPKPLKVSRKRPPKQDQQHLQRQPPGQQQHNW